MTGASPVPGEGEAGGGVRRRVAWLLLPVLLLAAVATTDTAHAALADLTAAAAEVVRLHPRAGAVVFMLLSAASAMLAFFSGAVLVPVAVETWGWFRTVTLLWVGWTAGGVAAYALARGAGRPLVARLVSADALARYERRVSPRTPWGVVLLLQLGLPSELPGYLMGLARYPLPRYVAALALGELPWALGTVLLGRSLLDRRVGWLLAIGVGAVLLGATAFWAVQRRLRAPSTGGEVG